MYAETGLMFPSFQNIPQQVDDFWCSQKPNASWGMPCSLIQTPTISDYNLGGAGDLFKAPEPVIEEPTIGLDPMTAAISMISCGEDTISPHQSLTVSDIESSMDNEQLLSDVFYEYKKDLLAKEATEMPVSEVLDISIPPVKTDQNVIAGEKLLAEGLLQKSVSSSYLRSIDCVHETQPRPNFLNFPVTDFGSVYGIRRAFSEGDMKGRVIDTEFLWQTLHNGNISIVQSPMGLPKIMSSSISEVRKEKLSRYWNKKSKRNFGRKIKYACRKALADGQPRIRGRFAKTEEIETLKKQ